MHVKTSKTDGSRHVQEACQRGWPPFFIDQTQQLTHVVSKLTHIIAEKEKKSSSYKNAKLDSLSEEKVTKIKKFAKDYIAKILRKLDKSTHRPKHPPSSAAPDAIVADTPNSLEDAHPILSPLEDSMALQTNDDHEKDVEMGDEESEKRPPEYSPEEDASHTADPMDLFSSPILYEPTDPRLRPPNGTGAFDVSDDDRDELDCLTTSTFPVEHTNGCS